MGLYHRHSSPIWENISGTFFLGIEEPQIQDPRIQEIYHKHQPIVIMCRTYMNLLYPLDPSMYENDTSSHKIATKCR